MDFKLTREDFINQYPPSNFLNKGDVEHLWSREHFNLYVHIPYCQEKCEFCYYKSQRLGDDPVPDEYVDALIKEIEMISVLPQVQRKEACSVYFGGGTPTKMTVSQFKKVLDKIKECFYLAEDYELCVEARPGKETSEEKLMLLKEYGIKRLSFGVQSLNDEILKINGRNHDVDAFYQTFERARKCKIPSINTDIMSGMVNETMDGWLSTLEKIIELYPENVAVYKLELYLNNVLYRRLRNKEIKLITDEEEAEQVRVGFRKLMDAGYIPVTNFSFASDMKYNHVHRKELWEGKDMLGIGASSHSCYDNFLFQNELNTQKYIERINRGESPIARAYFYDQRQKMIQRMVFGIKGMVFERKRFEREFGVDPMVVFGKELKELEQKKFIKIYDDMIKTTYEGMLYADDIVRIFYLPNQKTAYLSHVNRTRNKVV